MAGRRLNWARGLGGKPSETAFPKGERWQSARAASAVRHLVKDGRPVAAPSPGASSAGEWSPWVELPASSVVPMTGEVYSALALGGRMWSRSRSGAGGVAVELGKLQAPR